MRDAVHLLAVGDAAAVFAPSRFLGVAQEIGTADMVVVANLRNKVSRGGFSAGFFVQCLTAIGAHTVRLREPD
jgi:hypothetical protein